MRVAVVGAGVIGVTSAVAIKEAFPSAGVTVLADAFTPDTTGDGSAGLWGPYMLSNTDPQKILCWSFLTHKWIENFWKSDLAAEVGASLMPIIRVSSAPEGFPLPIWASAVYGAHELSAEQINRLNKQNKASYKSGCHFLTYTCEPRKLLPWLMEKFKSINGKIVRRKVTDLKSLQDEGYEIVINCTGIKSRDLVPDQGVFPIRGQVARVKAPWMFECFIEDDEDGNYIIPNMESIVLGGTHQIGDYNANVNPEDSKFIREGCERLYPSINKAALLREWVGLRPGRNEIRLEPEIVSMPGKEDLMIIHNYGHGGSGVTLCWGCALDVVDILRQQLKIKNLSKL